MFSKTKVAIVFPQMVRLFGRFTVLFFAISLSVGIVNAADLTSGMVGYWPLDGDAKDSVGDNDGELVGGAGWVRDGRMNGAVELDGSTGYVEVPDFELITDTITVVVWLNGWKQADWAGIVTDRNDPPFWMGFRATQDTLSYVWNNNSPETYNWNGGPTIPQDEWAMAAVAIEPDKATAYIYTDADGLKQGVNKIDHIEQIVDNLNFGWDKGFNDRHVKGVIDEVIIYDRVLTKDDILQLATSGLSVTPAAKLTTTWGMIKQ